MAGLVRLKPIGVLGAPVAAVYGAVVRLRRWAYDRGLLRCVAPPVLTIAVGGLEAGGSGKTPVTAFVLALLAEQGLRPGLLTRGYGRESRGFVVRRRGEEALPQALGDEPAMLVQDGLDVPVAACAQRAMGASALSALGCDALVLDDGFSHRRLGRDLDIVVLRGEEPFGNGHLIPWGALREPASSLRRADVVWLHFRGEASREPPEWARALCPRALLVTSRAVPTQATTRNGEPVDLAGKRIVAAAGIARPEDFAASLRGLGAEIAEFFPLADHQSYGETRVRALRASAQRCGAAALVVTPKDAVKLRAHWPEPDLWVVGTRVELILGSRAFAGLLEKRRNERTAAPIN